MSINDILAEALKREPLALKEAIHKELSARIVSLLEGDDEEDQEDADETGEEENDELDESAKKISS